MSILSESKFLSDDIIHFKTHPETVAKHSVFGPSTGNETCDTASLVQLNTVIDSSSSCYKGGYYQIIKIQD